ncbi:acetyl-CoA carboxylase carboxytransferase alpha subunit [Erysipelotrichaceae bacterium]|nr:acetyl-CoA carboxylase carboxytransferase alpha subunit [Erysipelotrichaceae bacterium]
MQSNDNGFNVTKSSVKTSVTRKDKDSLTEWERVQLARLAGRPTSLEYIKLLFNDFIELHGDRYYGDDHAIVGGIAMLSDLPVTVIAQQKGLSTEDNIYRNFGMPHPEGYRKSLRLMKQAEKFGRPVICFVDTQGAFPGIGAEERGQAEAIAQNLMHMSQLKVPIITVIIGEGGSGGALALAVADKVYMLENAIYSILSPEGFATILWKDASRAPEAAEKMRLTARKLREEYLIDRVIPEPPGGAQNNVDFVATKLRRAIIQDLKILMSKKTVNLVKDRYDRFRVIGVFSHSKSDFDQFESSAQAEETKE